MGEENKFTCLPTIGDFTFSMGSRSAWKARLHGVWRKVKLFSLGVYSANSPLPRPDRPRETLSLLRVLFV
jgi:hypothetical protein